MKRIIRNSCKAVLFIYFLSWISIIHCVNGDIDNNSHVSPENYSISFKNPEEMEMKGNSGEISITEDDFISSGESKRDVLGVLSEITSKNVGMLNDITINEGATVMVTLPETATLEFKAEKEQWTETLNNSAENAPSNVSEVVLETTISENGQSVNNTENFVNETMKEVTEEIPSFSEWAQKRMEEAEKKFGNETGNVGNNAKSGSVVKLSWKNYASPDCGAKVVAANPEAVSPSSVISPSREEYKLNVCTNRIWFIVELCEAIQAKKIDMANFELFSSTPKEFVVSIGDRFPSREWTIVGQFIAKDERDVQSFDLNLHLFGRYIKVEVKSHHGSQHYCPISLFRVYGVSELEVLQKEESSQNEDDDMDDDDAEIGHQDGLTKNMLNSATNAVYSMIKKAAEVLGTKSNETSEINTEKRQEYPGLINSCSTPSHNVVCLNCDDLLFGQVYELLSCKSAQIHNLATLPLITESLRGSHVCRHFGLNFSSSIEENHSKIRRYLEYVFPDRFLAAICNNLALAENKAGLNDSARFPNLTLEIPTDPFVVEGSKVPIEYTSDEIDSTPSVDNNGRPTDELRLDLTVAETAKMTCSTSLEYASQIKPTKTTSVPVEVSAESVEMEESEQMENNGEGEEQQSYGNAEVQEDQMENFLAEANGENGPTATPPVTTGNDRQKESVFLRLSNRIKALERNVSLSSQYLEELSRRYKKQVEEMQRLERNIQSMLEERKRMEDSNKELKERIDHLIVTIDKWPAFIFWFVTTVTILCGLCWICGGGEKQKIDHNVSRKNERRKSVDALTTKAKKKTRRPSDQALKIVRSSLLAEDRKLSIERKRRKKNNKILRRSISIDDFPINTTKNQELIQDANSSPKIPGDWVEENRRLVEIIDLDESENSSLEQFGPMMEQEVPFYAKTAAQRRASRISSQYTKPNVNGDLTKDNQEKRRISLEETGRKKEKKSFKSVLKNVFT